MKTRAIRLAPSEVRAERRAGGIVHLRSPRALPAYPRKMTERLDYWAERAPRRVFLAERGADGAWLQVTYAQVRSSARRIAAALLERRLSAERPLAVLSGNDIPHALLELAAMYAGVPYAPVSPAYSLVSSDFAQLRRVMELITPGLIYVSGKNRFQRAIDAVAGGIEVIDSLPERDAEAEVDAAHARVGPDTIAKFLFTSGSTGAPKAVINTQRMWCANQAMVAETLSWVQDEPPVMVDWAPWHHTAGGNKDFGMVLYNGGTMYLDEGKPLPGAIEATVRNLREVAPNWYFTVPKGYEMLLPYLKSDAVLRKNFFGRLKALWFAGAGVSQHIFEEYKRLACETCGEEILFLTGLGSTETAPFAIARTWDTDDATNMGVPPPGVDMKLVPMGSDADGRYEARLKGASITPGYWRQAELTRQAFDEEGYYRLGDAFVFADEANPAAGLLFRGRISEDFKLATGTWVHVGPLRSKFIAHFAPWVRDVVIAGEGRDELVALVFPATPFPPGKFESLLRTLGSTGSSNRIARAVVLEEPPSLDAGELTDKGSINQKAVLRRRRDVVEKLSMNLDALVAIDVHTHAWKSALAVDDAPTESQEAMGRYFRYQPQHSTVPEMAEMYRKLKMAFVVFTVDSLRQKKKITNEEIAELAHKHADVAIPFASVNPHRGTEGVRLARRLIKEYGVKGFKFHPSEQDFFPNDRVAYPLYEAIAEAKLPALFHTGQTGVGAGTPGGGGIRLKYSNPMLLDDVAADFPDMPIVLAHPSFPWQEEALSVATHKPQVYIDLSGWSPKYFPPILVQYANTLLKDKILFGTDYPVMAPERWIADFEKLPIKPEVRPLIMKMNAAKLLKL